MQRWRVRLQTIGQVEGFDYPYMRENRRRPDPLPQLIAAHRQALIEVRGKIRSQRSEGGDQSSDISATILIGKSMGGRIGCHVALEETVHGLVCLGYPLCGGGDQTKLSDVGHGSVSVTSAKAIIATVGARRMRDLSRR